MFKLKDFIDLFKENEIFVSADCNENAEIGYISYNSRDIKADTLFLCKGLHFKEQFLHDSLSKGAVAYVSERKYDAVASCILVSDIRRAMYLMANYFYDNAWSKLNLVGITGTKGKSTTAYFLKYIFDEYLKPTGKKSGLMSTLEIYDGVVNEESTLTTPEPFELHKHFDNAVKSGLSLFTMEVSSQALKYGRTAGVQFQFGCYLNIGIDHISAVEHPDFEDYFNSKMKLFSQCRTAVVNLDSDKSEEVIKAARNAPEVITFSTQNENADVYGYNIRKSGSDTVFTVKTKSFEEDFALSIPGLFNVSNALCAIAVCERLGIDADTIRTGLYRSRTAGRMEVYESEDKKITVIVDYAHNKLSFENIFDSVRKEYPERYVSIVFGCPGNKAVIRRKDMGEVSGKCADFVYITEDDPAEENLEDICKTVAQYVESAGGKDKYKIILDRGEAIKTAIEEANGESVIILAGKGAETHQKRGLVSEFYESDAFFAEKYLKEYDERQETK